METVEDLVLDWQSSHPVAASLTIILLEIQKQNEALKLKCICFCTAVQNEGIITGKFGQQQSSAGE